MTKLRFSDLLSNCSVGIDVGCAALILQDKVKVKSGTTIDHFFEDGVVLTDGTVMTVDKVIFAYVHPFDPQVYRTP
jgi:hypothetical protein